MNLAPYIPLAGSLCNVFFALFVYNLNRQARANKVYLVLGLAIAVWNFGSYRLFVVTDHDAALFWARFCFIGVIFTVSGFFHLSMVVAGVELGRWIFCLYCFQVGLLVLDWTPFFIKDVQQLGRSGWYARAGPAFHLLNVPYALSFVSLGVLWRKRKRFPQLQRHRLTSLIAAQLFLFVLGINDLLPIAGITHYPFTTIAVYPYGSLAAVFYGVIVAYSVLHHQLLDVQIALSHAAAHAVRFAFLFFISMGLLLVTAAATNAFTGPSFFLALAVFMTGAIVSSLVFPRLFGGAGFEKLERRILGDRFEYHDQIRSFIDSMQWYTDTNLLLSDLNALLAETVRVGNYRIILLDETSRVYSLFRSYPEEPPQQYPELHNDSPAFRYFEESKAEYLPLNLAYGTASSGEDEKGARAQLNQFGAEFCFPFSFEDQPFGLLLLGTKANRDPYTSTDITLLVSLVKHLSLVINQIRLKSHILHTQELELLGRMSRGMAHDLNNLLTPVWTFLQLTSEGASAKDLNEDLLPVALRNITTMRSYIREALFYSENLRPDFQLGRLDILIGNAVEVVKQKLESHQVNITINTPGEVLVEMDEVLIQRTISNIISNASDASPERSTIRVELVRLIKTEIGREWLRVRVIDSGEGIRPEDMDRIFTPYFTTKNRGDEDRGFGLGLAICRKIIHLHGGNLNVESKLKRGTTIQIDLPSRQSKSVPAPVSAVSLAS